MKPKVKNQVLLQIYEKTFKYSLFNITRNPIGYNWALSNFPTLKFDLKPDPAFGMKPSKPETVSDIIKELASLHFLKNH